MKNLMTSETVTISRAEYDRLLANDNWLECLDAAGVDNWDGIELAIQIRDGNGLD